MFSHKIGQIKLGIKATHFTYKMKYLAFSFFSCLFSNASLISVYTFIDFSLQCVCFRVHVSSLRVFLLFSLIFINDLMFGLEFFEHPRLCRALRLLPPCEAKSQWIADVSKNDNRRCLVNMRHHSFTLGMELYPLLGGRHKSRSTEEYHFE